MNHRLSLAVCIAACACIGSVHADNLIQNPDFDLGLEGWTQVGSGTVTIDDSIGMPEPPSAHLTADSTAGVGIESTCMEIDDSTNVDFRVDAQAPAGSFFTSVEAFSDATCTISNGGSSTSALGGGMSEYDYLDFPLPVGTRSAKILLSASSVHGNIPDAYFDHVGFGPAGTFDSSISIQQGLSGAWYNPQTSGQGLEFVVSQDRVFLTDSAVFGAWYTYDTTAGGPDAQRWYSFQTTRIEPGITTATVVIYQNIGGNFDAPPTTSAVVVGTGTLMFDTCSTGSFTYQFDDGRTGTIPLRRLLPNVTCAENSVVSDPPSDFGLSGSWYNQDTSGQGLMINVDPVDAQVFLGWFTYAMNGEGQGASGQRWFSAQGGYTVGSTSMDLTLYASTGGTFDSDDTAVTTQPVGTATLTYANCTTATFDYDFTSGELSGQSGSIALTRLETPLTSCDLPN
jgi:hypothetical protein